MTTGRASETYSHFQRVTRSQSMRPEPTPVVEETASTAASPSPRPDTAIPLALGYDNSQAAVLPRVPAVEPVVREPERDPSPGRFAVLMHCLPRYLPRLFQDAEQTFLQMAASLAVTFLLLASVAFTLLSLSAVAPLPGSLSPYRDQFHRGIRVAFGGIDPFYAPENITAPPSQPVYNKLMFFKTEDMVKATNELKTQVGFHNDSISELRRLLPDALAVKMDENGNYIIPEPFWKALLEKIGNDGAAPLWESFISGNKDKLNAMISENSAHRDTSGDDVHSISQFDFESTLAANNKMHEDDLRLQFNNFKELVLQEARLMVREGNAENMRMAEHMLSESVTFRISTQQISALSLTNLLYNAHRVQNEVNHFSPGLGAVVDPKYTSATASPNEKFWLGYFYMNLWQASMTPNPPVNALTGWDEGTQCWCADHGNEKNLQKNGKAQLTVKMAHKIRPKEIIIEHIPAKGTRDIAAAPRDFQVWAQLDNKTEAIRVQAEMNKTSSYVNYTLPLCGKPPNDEKTWVCMLTAHYDLHANNNVQAKYLLGSDVVETDRIAVRVTENWGAKDHTCLYRVRVTGEEVDKRFPQGIHSPIWRDRAALNLDGQAEAR